MMKHTTAIAAFLLMMLTLLPGGSPKAQGQADNNEAELLTARYVEAYDSLVNSYYLRRHTHHRLPTAMQFDIESFDATPDSLIEARLQALHTVIPMTYNSVVRSYIRFYLRHMSTRLDLMLTLCEYYHPLFEETLNRYNVPEELKYLTIVESAMNAQATSRAGAAGLWQFMYPTGKLYDLEVNSVIDERRDPYKSTIAAARHLKDLYKVYGDWELAIAAYNCGSGNVNKAIARSGGARNYWHIYPNLPRETRGYVPAFTAVIYVMNYYDEHGLRPSKLNLPVRTDTVMLRQDVMLNFVAELTASDLEELHTINPQYRTNFIPASTGSYSLCLPSNKIESFISLQDSIYALTADSLSRKPVRIEPRIASTSSSSSGSGKYYTVRKGDTLYKIASKHGISVQTLKKKNNIKGDNIRVGQKLRVR